MKRKIFDKYVLKTYDRVPLTLVKGKGMKVWDDAGNEYLDFFPGWGAGNIGHCHPTVTSAIQEQLNQIMHVPNVYYSKPQGELARLIIENSFGGQVFFCNSGAEANEGAIKLARKYRPEKYEIITLENSFHGRTIATVTATGQPAYQNGFGPLPDGFRYCELNNIDMLEDMMSEKTAAIMLEPILGEGGIKPVSQEFMQAARKLCDQYETLLILDEVQTGIGRTGKMFGYQNFNITPDIMTLAKSLGGGMPVGALVVKQKYCNILTPGAHGSTFGGNALACAAGIAVTQTILKKNMLAKSLKAAAYMSKELESLKKKCSIIKEVRGIGLMIGIELDRQGADIVRKCREKGLLIRSYTKRIFVSIF